MSGLRSTKILITGQSRAEARINNVRLCFLLVCRNQAQLWKVDGLFSPPFIFRARPQVLNTVLKEPGFKGELVFTAFLPLLLLPFPPFHLLSSPPLLLLSLPSHLRPRQISKLRQA